MNKYILPAVFALLFAGFLFVMDKGNSELIRLGKENNTYHRTTACILSVPLASRTDAYISNCYHQAERKNGIEVDHFGNK